MYEYEVLYAYGNGVGVELEEIEVGGVRVATSRAAGERLDALARASGRRTRVRAEQHAERRALLALHWAAAATVRHHRHRIGAETALRRARQTPAACAPTRLAYCRCGRVCTSCCCLQRRGNRCRR